MSDPSKRVEVPSIFLIVTGVLGIVLQLYSVVSSLTKGNELPPEVLSAIPADQQALVESVMGVAPVVGPLIALCLAALSALVLVGGLQMKSTGSYALAMTGAIAALVPCSFACCLGLPVGIWCIVVLMNDEVKAAFE